jgi:hypothetical protein
MWLKLKLKRPNIAIRVISEHSVITMVETHYEIDTTTIYVNNQMAIIPSTSWEEHY